MKNNTEPQATETKASGGEVSNSKNGVVRPRVGQTWALGTPDGRKVRISRIGVGPAGRWTLDPNSNRPIPMGGKKQRVYVHAGPMCATYPVAEWLRTFYFIA